MTDQELNKDMIGSRKTIHALDNSRPSGKKLKVNDQAQINSQNQSYRDHCGPHISMQKVNEMSSASLPHSESEDDMILDDGFTKVKNPIKPRLIPAPPPTETANQYAPLQDQDNAAQDVRDNLHSRPYKPGSLFIYSRTNKYLITQRITMLTKAPVRISHNAEGIIVNARTTNDQATIIQFCKENNIEFASQKAKHDQPLKVIIRKLPIETPVADIQKALTDLHFSVQKVCQLSGKDKNTGAKVPFPLFLVHLQKTANVSDIYNLDGLLYFKILIEPYKSHSLTQCYRCQRFGHTQTSCCAAPRCVRCGEQHFTSDCQQKGTKTPPRCVNCKEEGHTANYLGCTAAKNYKKAQNKAMPPPKSAFPPLSQSQITPEPPTTNSKTKKSYAQATTAAETPDSKDDMSFTAMFTEIKNIFKTINISTILTKLRACSHKLKNTTDSTEKILLLVETLVTIVDDCN